MKKEKKKYFYFFAYQGFSMFEPYYRIKPDIIDNTFQEIKKTWKFLLIKLEFKFQKLELWSFLVGSPDLKNFPNKIGVFRIADHESKLSQLFGFLRRL